MLIGKGQEFTDSEEESEVQVHGLVEDTLGRTEIEEPANKKKIYKSNHPTSEASKMNLKK